MDAAAECAEQLVALRKLEEAASLSHSGAEEVHQRSADRLLALARTNKGAYLKIAQHLSQAAPTEKIFIELMSSDRKLKASREGSK